jgi:hypothetical protein
VPASPKPRNNSRRNFRRGRHAKNEAILNAAKDPVGFKLDALPAATGFFAAFRMTPRFENAEPDFFLHTSLRA